MNEYDIAKMYQEMELELIASLKRNLKRHLKEEKNVGIDYPAWQALKLKELQRVKEENLEIIKKHTSTIPRDVSRIINREYKQGRTSAQKLFAKSKEGHGDKMNQSFFNVDNQKVNMLIDEINGTVRDADSAMFRMINDKYRSTIFKANFFLENGATTIDGAVDMALRDFIRTGINCIQYADGRRVNIADYTRMAVRTASQRAMLYAEGDFRKERGKSLVMVTKHNTACKLCQPWENKVLIDDIYSGGMPDGKHKLVSQAMKAGLFHPNCRHGLPTYYPELDEVYDDIARNKSLQEEEESLRDEISQYYQRERRFALWNNPDIMHFIDDGKKRDSNLNLINEIDKILKETKEQEEKYKPLEGNLLEKYQKQSKELFNKIRKNREIEDAINSYIGDDFVHINKLLANGKIEDNEKLKNISENIDKLMNKFKLDDDIVVYRGTEKKYYINKQIGSDFTEKVYYSTSYNKEIAKDFANVEKDITGNDGILLEIRIPKNTKCVYIGENNKIHDEGEILLSRNLKYKVINRKNDNYILLEVINE